MCKYIQIGDRVEPIKALNEERFVEHIKSFGKRGQRNICFAKKIVERQNVPSVKSLKIVQSLKNIEEERSLNEMTFLGIISIADPLKEGIE